LYVGQYGHIALNGSNVAANTENGLIQFLLPSPCDEDKRAFVYKSLPLLPPVIAIFPLR
jgi:hypothetical protein